MVSLFGGGEFGGQVGAVLAFGSPGGDQGYSQDHDDEEFSCADPVFPGHFVLPFGVRGSRGQRLGITKLLGAVLCSAGRSEDRPLHTSTSEVVDFAGQDLRWVSGVGSAIPGEQAAHGVAGHGIKFPAQHFTADGEAVIWIAERG
jgi:hypothetical protein